MEIRDKLEYAIELFAEDYKLDEHLAKRIINGLDAEDNVLEKYEEEIQELEKEEDEEYEKEKEMNKDLLYGDIHGGV